MSPFLFSPTACAGEARLRLRREEATVEVALGWVHGTQSEMLPQAAAMLSEPEARHLASLEFPRRRESYLLGRLAAKRALGLLLHEPDGRRISVYPGAFDQPLVEYPATRGVGVSITHAEGVAMAVGFPAAHPLGIDIERLDARRLDVLAAQMSAEERAWVAESGLELLKGATLLWTMKEALAKALTTGLMCPWEIYATTGWRDLGAQVWEARFANFAQYRVVAWLAAETVLSLALPRNSQLPAEAAEILRGALGR